MPGLRDILDAATPGQRSVGWDGIDGCWFVPELPKMQPGSPHGLSFEKEADAQLAALAPELAALCLDMGEYLQAQVDDIARDDFYDDTDARAALLSRLSRLGAGDSNQNEKEQT